MMKKDNKNQLVKQLKKRILELEKEVEILKREYWKSQKQNELLKSKNYQANKKLQELLVENENLKNELALASYRADMAAAVSQSQVSVVRGMLSDVAKILGTGLSAELDRKLTQEINWQLAEGMKKLRKEIEEAYGKKLDDVVWRTVESRFRTMLESVMSLVPKMPVLEKPKAVEAKEKRKGGK